MDSDLRRLQRKPFLATCRRIAVVGLDGDPDSNGFVSTEKLLGLGLEIVPIIPGRGEFLGVRCYPRLREVPGHIDLVQIYPGRAVLEHELVRDATERKIGVFWIEGQRASAGLMGLLRALGVQIVENESLADEYIKHVPASVAPVRRAVRVDARMTANPATVRAGDAVKDAVEKMRRGRFRHLPVVDEAGKLIGMISDRDIRSIQASLAFTSEEEAAAQLWSASVRQAAVFNPVTVGADAPLETAAELMVRWDVGALPVTEGEKLVGIITYSDLLREFVARADGKGCL